MDNSDKPKNNLLNRYYPQVFPAGEDVPEWNIPSVDSLDRFLRAYTKSGESRDIIRALIRHREDPFGGVATIASDDQIADWTGLDPSNVGRRIREDRIFRTLCGLKRGKPRRFGEKPEANEFDFTDLFERWKAFIEAEKEPPHPDLIRSDVGDWATEKRVLIGSFVRDVVAQAFTEVAARMKRPLVRRDRRKVTERAIRLAQERLAQQAARPAPSNLSFAGSRPAASV